MNRNSSSVVLQVDNFPNMDPTNPKPTAKRKAVDDDNPLLAAAKRSKKEVCG